MKPPSSDQHLPSEQERSSQSVHAGKNATVVGRDFSSTTNFNFTIWVVGVLALGGLAWAIYTGRISNPINTTPVQPQSSPRSQNPALLIPEMKRTLDA